MAGPACSLLVARSSLERSPTHRRRVRAMMEPSTNSPSLTPFARIASPLFPEEISMKLSYGKVPAGFSTQSSAVGKSFIFRSIQSNFEPVKNDELLLPLGNITLNLWFFALFSTTVSTSTRLAEARSVTKDSISSVTILLLLLLPFVRHCGTLNFLFTLNVTKDRPSTFSECSSLLLQDAKASFCTPMVSSNTLLDGGE